MFARIALARVLMIDSMDKAVPHIKKALSMAEQYGNRLCALSALELLCYTYEPRHDARKIINLIRESFSLYGDKPQSTAEENIYNNLLYNAATNYIYLGKLTLPDYTANPSKPTVRQTVFSSIRYMGISQNWKIITAIF